uniref:VPS37 C-terminal domain-containing protein n=1 Tax=Prasinoderma coloniale TaxID=156133 RepID=A0A7R9TJB8_9VIRI
MAPAVSDARAEQVVGLQKASPAVVEVDGRGGGGGGGGSRGGSSVAAEFELPLQLPRGRGAATLHVCLSDEFPAVSPELRVSPPVSHPWVDRESGAVGFKRTRLWDVAKGSNLAKVVSDVVATLGAGAGALGGANGSRASGHNEASMCRQSSTTVPAVPERFLALGELSNDELLTLLTSSSAFDAFAAEQGNAGQLAEMVQQAQDECKALAEANLALEPDIKNGRGHVAIVRSTELEPALEAYRGAMAKQAEALAAMSTAGIMARLGEAVKESKDESEALEHSLCDVPPDEADAALDRYLRLRKQFWLRSAIKEAYEEASRSALAPNPAAQQRAGAYQPPTHPATLPPHLHPPQHLHPGIQAGAGPANDRAPLPGARGGSAFMYTL